MKLRNKKTGETGELQIVEKHCAVALGNGTSSCGISIYCSLAELNEEWEDYEEPKEYWYIDTCEGWEIDRTEEGFGLTDKENKEIGNYFETKEEAERVVEKLKAWRRLKDKGFKLDAVVDSFFCIDIYMKGKPYEEIKEDLKIVFGGEE